MNAIDLLQTVAIITSILLSIWQVRAHTSQIRSAQLQNFSDSFNEINMLGFQNPDYFKEFSREFEPEAGPNEAPFYFLGLIFGKYENAFIQVKEYRTMTKEYFDSQVPLLIFFLETSYGQGWWQNVIGADIKTVDDDFLLYIDAIMKRAK